MRVLPLTYFLRESNFIEGIRRDPSPTEARAAEAFMGLFAVTVADLNELQAAFAPGLPLRGREGMNVRVGSYVAPPGGPNIVKRLQAITARANHGENPWHVHCRFEMLHPYLDGNGRTGRMLWAWQMQTMHGGPFDLPFLHRWYYQTLENAR